MKRPTLPTKQAISYAASGLPPFAKNALAASAALALIYIGYKVLKAPATIVANRGNNEEKKDIQKELDRIGKTATLSNSQASGIANALHTAMDGYGTDETGIQNQFKKIKNNADFLKVQSAYGTRTISSGAYNPSPNYKGTLVGGLGSELSAYWTAAINKALTASGVTYQV